MKKTLLILSAFASLAAGAQNLSISEVGRFTDGRDGACEISAYDAASQKLFITNAVSDSVDIVDVSNFSSPVRVGSLDILSYGGGVNSVATLGNGHVAVAIEANVKQDSGVVAFYDTAGVYVTHVKVGALPDMIKLTPDGNKVIVANEGEPNDDYDVDPLGSVSIIDISGGIATLNQSNVSFVDFTAYNGQETSLRLQGTLIFGQKQIQQFNYSLVGRYTDGRDGACEISAYDSTSNKIFVTNAATDSIDIISVTTPASPSLVGNIDVLSYGGGVNSVVNIGNGHIAAAIQNSNKQLDGKIVFFDVNGNYVNDVNVGALPDMVTITKDKTKLVVANEGEPNDDYDVDPLGSVSIIDISGGIVGLNQTNVTTIDFTSYNGTEATLRSQGALIFGKQPIVNEGLFFSEYMEGSSNNKYMEIYNATDSTVYLDTFAFPNVSNAPTTIGDYEFWNTFPVGDSILSGDVYIIAHPSANATILAQADHTFTFMSNGNDGFALVHGNSTTYTVVDYIGDFNGDPGTGWDVAGVTNATANHTLVRKSTIGKGNNNWVASAGTNTMDSEWEVYPIDSIVSLGTHTVDSYIASSVAQDLEPEYIATDSSSTKAYVACQENNALAIIDLATATIDTIVGLGFKDFNATGNGMDASNKDNIINIQNWNVKGVYQPDAIDMFRVNGNNYIITANEGDARDYDGYSAETRIKDLTLDPTTFPNAATLQMDANLGRLNSFTPDVIGDTDADGDIDELYAYGARSFSIWDDAGNLIWDSGDQFEQYIAANHSTFFNCNDGLAAEQDERSDDKGPEPEAVTVGWMGNVLYAFIGLERQGGIMVYDITDPISPSFVDYIETLNVSAGTMDDIAPEGLVFVPAASSHTGTDLLIVSNEVSGTVAIYEFTTVAQTPSTVAEDLEPEYITTDPNSTKAYVACQENNALAIIDIATASLDTIVGLGYKDFNAAGNGIDASNKDNMINIQNWNVKGVYQPDAIDMFSIASTNYILSANEGDARDYDGYSAETRIKDLTLDPTAFPNAATLQADTNLGRLNSFTPDVIGDTDADGDIDELYAYGARSFSIWDDAGNLVWDSGDQFEQYIAANHPDFFNCDDGLAAEKDERSDDKGPEPEAIVAGKIGANTYAFIGLERQGGIMVYNITNPASPVFEQFVNNYNVGTGTMIDIAPEGLVFVPAANSHTGTNVLIVSNEVSGTATIYEVDDIVTGIEENVTDVVSIYPNPSKGIINISSSLGGVYQLRSLIGSEVLSGSIKAETIKQLDISGLSNGVYLLNTVTQGISTTHKIIKN